MSRAPKEEKGVEQRNKGCKNAYSVRSGQACHVLADIRGRNGAGDEVDARTLQDHHQPKTLKMQQKEIHLIQNAIRRILDNSNDALGSSPSRRKHDTRLAIVPQTRLHDGRQQTCPIPRGGLIERCAEEPGRLGVDGGQGDEVAADVEVCDVVLGKVDGETPAGWSAFEIVIEADGRGGLEEEVCCCLTD